MQTTKSGLLGTITAGIFAAGLMAISPLLQAPAYADEGTKYQQAQLNDLQFDDLQTYTAPVEEVVLDNFTPPAPRAPRLTRTGVQPMTPSGDLAIAGVNSNAGHNGPTDLKAGPGCSIQCIASGVAYARGVGAKLVVKTDTPASILIMVWDDDGYVRVVGSGAGDVTSFGHVFDDLQPGQTYYAAAIAEDSQGYASQAEGSFVTLNRYVQVSLSSANILDHAFSNSNFSKSVWANGQWLAPYAAGPLVLQGSSLNWGNNEILLSNVDRYLDFAVQLSENDLDPEVCEASAGLDQPILGPGSCAYYAYAHLHDGDNDLDDRPANATSWVEHTLQRTLMLPGGGALPPGFGSPLEFTVDVTLQVIYQ